MNCVYIDGLTNTMLFTGGGPLSSSCFHCQWFSLGEYRCQFKEILRTSLYTSYLPEDDCPLKTINGQYREW